MWTSGSFVGVTLSVCEIVKFQNDCLLFHLTMFDVAKKTCSHQSVTSTRLVRFCDGWPFIGNLRVDVLPVSTKILVRSERH